ncbi:MAG: amidohydrolase, partial [Frankiales bacterium]|nr:amidohydrolase [Frankiales bacterium]
MPRVDVLHLRGPVLVGPDDVRPEAWVVGGRLTFSRPHGEVTPVEGWVLPGMVDAHCHIGLGKDGAVDAAEAERQALADRDAGALLLRDAGSPADTRWVDDREDLPVLVRAGRHIARPRRYLRGYADEVEPEDLLATVVRQAGAGDGWVKLVGDWIDRDTGDLAACWPAEVLAPAIAAAHAAGARVTAHCFAEDALRDLVEAGIDCIEHGTGLTADTIPLFAERGVTVVPTLINIATFPDIAAAAEAKFPGYAAHMRALHARRHDTVRAAHEAGIRLFVGTDAGGSLAHGRVVEEVLELHRAGLTAVQALDAATWGARAWLGRTALEEGAQADL